MGNMDIMSINAIRVLSADMIQKANSGHPGLPLGSAAMAYELWAHHMNHNPENPSWANRDRFILSGGHGSAMLYSLFHLFGYGNLSLDELKQFRQFGSLTPGHPEYRHTVGVEATTGPLGAGMAMAVGMAMAEAHLAAIFNKEGYPVVDHYTYALGGDGCLMEGISSEAFSLAGTLGLSRLIILYDSNRISIEGSTDIAFCEDVALRMQAFGFQTLEVMDGNDPEEIGRAIEEAKRDKERPSFITVHTEIGYGSPKQGMASAHGEPLGEENVRIMKRNLGWPSEEPFEVPEEVYAHYKEITEQLKQKEEDWNRLFEKYCTEFPEMKEKWDVFFDRGGIKKALDSIDFWTVPEKAEATRNLSGSVLNRVKDVLPQLMGGSADLAPSTKTNLKDAGDFSKEDYSGRNLHFGIREIAMAGIGNGLQLHGGVIPYVSTFFVFSDYVKPMARLSSLMGLPLTYVLTHDSIGVGEDGPTHEPIEQAAMFRAMPNFNLWRPADAMETNAAWYAALTSEKTPSALALTRQNLPQLSGSSKEALKGGYILEDSEKETPDAIIIATGSEVQLAVEARAALKAEGIDVRVVSLPCMDVFEAQDEAYKESILPKCVTKRVGVEALSEFGWGKYIGLEGRFIGMKSFGASAPNALLFRHFGITADNVVRAVKEIL